VVARSWGWLLALVTVLSATEGGVVFFSRRWDDWLSFHASRLAAIRPEDEAPKTPKLAFDLKWLYRKLKRRARGYVVFAAGLPALLPLRLVPTVGAWLFTIAATFWGWYWLGVFSAAKSAHAWADEEQALSPAPIRTLNERLSNHALFAPVRWYGRAWARITRSVNPASTTFERSPGAFLGLALARVILSLPGLYLLARPIVPVAAGRLCAEVHPADRFTVTRDSA
jgi:cobalamin biosynthesis protein CobD/CbiB